jgi:hypothetical protein
MVVLVVGGVFKIVQRLSVRLEFLSYGRAHSITREAKPKIAVNVFKK